MRQTGGHKIDGLYCAQGNYPRVAARVTDNTNRTNGQEHSKRLAHLVIPIRAMQLFHKDGISTAQDVAVLFFHLAEHANAETWSGEWVAIDHVIGQAEFYTYFAHFVFEAVSYTHLTLPTKA